MTNPQIYLSEHNPEWENQFNYEKKRIINAIGNELIEIEHIGSTSIPRLIAKPIIDLMVGISDLDDVAKLITPLARIEFEYVPKPELVDRYFFRKGEWGKGTAHLHICEMNGVEWTEKLLFRDYLRLHPSVASEYAFLKDELARYAFDRTTYTLKKEPFIKDIIEKARKCPELGRI